MSVDIDIQIYTHHKIRTEDLNMKPWVLHIDSQDMEVLPSTSGYFRCWEGMG